MSDREVILAYHERTKHFYGRFARSAGSMDWDTQPDPFRRYAGAPVIPLPLPLPDLDLPFWKLHIPRAVTPAPLNADSLSRFFRYALSLTAQKRAGDQSWSLRANPSSGNLHPTEGYAVLPAVQGFHPRPGVYHYAPKEHALERRSEFGEKTWKALVDGMPDATFLVGITSIYWREAWKYGERAFRYCQHDAGHAWGSLRYAAATLGWSLRLLDRNDGSARLLGVDRDLDYGSAEREDLEFLAVVSPAPGGEGGKTVLPNEALAQIAGGEWTGAANALSPAHGLDWDAIEEAASATEGFFSADPEDLSGFPPESGLSETPARSGSPTAEKVILGRRSAVQMDGSTGIPLETFYSMLARLVPDQGHRRAPWDAVPWRPRIHLLLFVHRVTGLAPGLYALVRDPVKVPELKNALTGGFKWLKPDSCPAGLPFFQLQEGDVRGLAAELSCGQTIAGNGAFSLGMLAEYLESLVVHGTPFYRNLFWESGLVGQALYLEAEAAGLRGTGIGCFFDDPVHQAFGLKGKEWQSLYHFTVGTPVEDGRLRTLDPYAVS